MWKRSIVLLLAFCAVCAYDVDLFKERLTQFRIRSQNLHVDTLEREVEELEHEFDQLSSPISQADVIKVKARLQNLEGERLCDETQISCGGQSPQCVSHLFVCDGQKDCNNGRDEDEEFCSMDIIRPGSTFKGIIRWRRLYANILVTVTESHRSNFGPLAWVNYILATATEEGDFKMTSYLNKGYFSFAFREMATAPQLILINHYTNVCSFHLGDKDHLECRTRTFYNTTAVGWFRLVRT